MVKHSVNLNSKLFSKYSNLKLILLPLMFLIVMSIAYADEGIHNETFKAMIYQITWDFNLTGNNGTTDIEAVFAGDPFVVNETVNTVGSGYMAVDANDRVVIEDGSNIPDVNWTAYLVLNSTPPTGFQTLFSRINLFGADEFQCVLDNRSVTNPLGLGCTFNDAENNPVSWELNEAIVEGSHLFGFGFVINHTTDTLYGQLYINGTLMVSNTSASAEISSTLDLWINNREGSTSTGFTTANFHTFMFFDEPLTDAQIELLYQITVVNGTEFSPEFHVHAEADTTFPLLNSTFNNTAPKIGEFVNASWNVSDETGLATANLTINFTTGLVKLNATLSGTDAQLSNSTNITDKRGTVLNFTFYVTDTSANVRQNSTLITVADTLSTVTIATNNSNPKINEVINISSTITDDDTLSSCLIKTNQTGVFVNNTFFFSTTTASCSDSITITVGRGNSINFTVEVNDSVGGIIVQNSLLITVANTPPTITSIVAGAKEKEPFNSSLKLYLDMDDWNGTYVLDRTTNNNDGLIFGANRSYGRLGWGMVFDGTDDFINIDTALTNSLATTTVGTWTAWIRLVDTTPAAFERIIAFSDASANAVLDMFVSTSGVFRVVVRNAVELKWDLDTDSPAFSDDTWTYIALVQDGVSPVMYIDGVAVAQAFTTSTDKTWWFSDDSNLDNGRIGNFNKNGAGETNHFNGAIDEVQIWDVALSPDEIAKRYSQGRGTGNITTQTPLATAVNVNSDADSDVLFTVVDWYKNNILNATTGRPDDDNVSLWMTFDQRNISGTIEDYSINNHTGVIVGARFTNDSAMGLGAFEFDGEDDYITIADDDSLSPHVDGNMTISWWFNVNNSGTVEWHLGKGSTSNWEYGVGTINTVVQFTMWQSSGGTHCVVSSSNSFVTNAWNYATIGYINGISCSVILNTVKTTSTTITGVTANGNQPLIIGNRRASGDKFMNGTLDELRIDSRFLSDSENEQRYWASAKKGLILNQSQTKKNENWNVSESVCDSAPSCTNGINFTFDTIQNTVPNGTNFINTSGFNDRTNLTINWSKAFDPDFIDGIDTLNYVLFSDTSNPPTTLVANTTQNNYTTNWTADGDYFFQIKVMDGSSESGLSPVFNLTLDTAIPTITNNNVTNNTFLNHNITAFFTGNDINIFNATGNLSNSSNTFQFIFNGTPLGTTTLNIIANLNITALADGNYTWSEEVVDSHSKPLVNKSEFKKGKKGETILIFNDTILNKEITVGIFFREKNNKLTDTPADIKSFTDFNEEGFVTFGLNFTVVKPETKVAFNVSTNIGDVKILDTNFTGHLLLIPYGMDFDGTLLVNGIEVGYSVTITRNAFNEVEVLLIPNILLKAGDVVVFKSETLFGLNVFKQDFTIVVDQTVPVINEFNVSGLVNNSFVNVNFFNVSANGTDVYTDSILLYINDKTNASVKYGTDITVNITDINIGRDGNYTFLIRLNDTANNEINSSIFYNIVIDTVSPIVVNATNRTTTGSKIFLDNLNANLSLFFGDIYLDKLNISENSNGNHVNHSITVTGNNTYSYIISSANLSKNEIITWSYYGYDKSGNLVTDTFSFTVLASSSPSPAEDTGATGGSTGSVGVPSVLTPSNVTPTETTTIIGTKGILDRLRSISNIMSFPPPPIVGNTICTLLPLTNKVLFNETLPATSNLFAGEVVPIPTLSFIFAKNTVPSLSFQAVELVSIFPKTFPDK